jgi:shikimate kinase
MNEQLRVVLVGLPGSGKSTFGRYMSSALNLSFYDLDQLIEERKQMKIPNIFLQYGEGQFRNWETETLKWILDRDESYVLASGGGCPCFNKNIDLMNKKSTTVYLDVPLQEISVRLGVSRSQNRPMFSGLKQGAITLKLKSLLIEREYFYNQSKIKLSGENLSAELLLAEFIRLTKSQD